MIPDHITETRRGRLLLTGGAHDVRGMMFGTQLPLPGAVENLKTNIRVRAEWCAARHIPYRHYIFPDPINFARSELDDGAGIRPFLHRYWGQNFMSGVVEYPLALLDDEPNMQRMTDTHYSLVAGAHLAADMARRLTGLDTTSSLAEALMNMPKVNRVGDLGQKCDPPRSESLWMPRRIPDLQIETNGLTSGNDGIIDLAFSPHAAIDATLLLFGDSFMRGMVEELGRYWQRIVMCRSRFFHEQIAEAVRPDHLATGMAERYLASVPPDAMAPHLLAIPLLAGRELAPSAGFGDLFRRLIDQPRLARAATFSLSNGSRLSEAQVMEQTAFALFLEEQEDEIRETCGDISDVWSTVRIKYRQRVQKLTTIMKRRGLQIESK